MDQQQILHHVIATQHLNIPLNEIDLPETKLKVRDYMQKMVMAWS